jgi:hypothetical protein
MREDGTMTLHRIHNEIHFECDDCHEELNTETSDFRDSIQVLREDGWTAFPIGDDWHHRCPDCRSKRKWGEEE